MQLRPHAGESLYDTAFCSSGQPVGAVKNAGFWFSNPYKVWDLTFCPFSTRTESKYGTIAKIQWCNWIQLLGNELMASSLGLFLEPAYGSSEQQFILSSYYMVV